MSKRILLKFLGHSGNGFFFGGGALILTWQIICNLHTKVLSLTGLQNTHVTVKDLEHLVFALGGVWR